MKRFLTLIMIIVMIFTLASIVFAEETEADTEIIQTTETETGKIDRIVESITNSTFWVIVGGFLTALVSVLAIFYKHFNSIALLIRTKATSEEITSALKDAKSEITDSFKAEYNSIQEQLKAEQDNTKKLIIMLSIFMSNAKINSNAKSQIMQIMSGIKDISGNITEVVESINEIIEKSNAEEKVETPALDEMLNEALQPSLSLD